MINAGHLPDRARLAAAMQRFGLVARSLACRNTTDRRPAQLTNFAGIPTPTAGRKSRHLCIPVPTTRPVSLPRASGGQFQNNDRPLMVQTMPACAAYVP